MGSKSYSKGISWINDCRIPFVDEGDKNKTLNSVWSIDEETKQSDMGFGTKKIGNVSVEQGRFPANILVSDDMLNDGNITSQNTGVRKNPGIKTKEWEAGYKKIEIKTQGDKGTNSRYYNIDKWFDNLIDV
jgi:hypothetical protein